MDKPLTELSKEDIFKYFSLEKRKTLAKSIKGLRKMHAKLPLRLQLVEITRHTVMIDELKWVFIFDGNLKMLEEHDNGQVFFKIHKLEMINCNGKSHDFKDHETFLRFLNYYLNRKGSWIQSFCIFEAGFKTLPTFREISVFSMQLEFKPGYYERWGRKFLEEFKNNQFSELFLRNFEPNNKFAVQIKDMKIQLFILFALDRKDDSFTQLNFPKMQLMEGAVDYDGVSFLDNVKKLIENNPDHKNLIYQIHSQHSLDIDWKAFIRKAQRELGVKHKFRGYDGHISIELPNGREVEICCKLVQFASKLGNYYTLEAVFEEDRKPSVSRSQLTTHTTCLSLMNFYQVVMTQALRHYALEQEQLGRPHSTLTMSCLLFLNTHHLRLLTFAGSFGFSRLVLWALPRFPSRKWSLLASAAFSLGVTCSFFRGYDFNCRKYAILDFGMFSDHPF